MTELIEELMFELITAVKTGNCCKMSLVVKFDFDGGEVLHA